MITPKHFPLRLLVLALLLVPVKSLFAQELTADLQLLNQGEIRVGAVLDDDQDPDAEFNDRANFLVSRARLNLAFKKGGLQMQVSPQYSNIWGQQGYGSFHMFEAWAKYTLPFGLFAQIGRQALSYDDERIIGPNDWAMAAVSHDVLKLGYEGHGHKVHAILAYNQNPENLEGGTAYVDGSQPYKTMQTLWYHYDVPHIGLGASLLFMNLGVQGDEKSKHIGVFYQQMLGTHLSYKPSWGEFSASYYHQMGKDFQEVPIDAWMAAAKAMVKPSKVFSFTAGYDYLSGDPYFVVPKEGQIGVVFRDKIRGFTSLYGSHHKFYGMMEFFYVSTYYHGFSPGLQNAYAGLTATFAEKVSLSATYHYMATATRLEGLKMALGHCVELSASYDITKDISLSAGFSYMKGTETMDRLKRKSNKGDLRWAWINLTFTPRILNLKW